MDSGCLLTIGDKNNYSPHVVLDLSMHDSEPLAFTNGFPQVSTRRNLSVIASTHKEIAVGSIRRFEYSTGCVALSRERYLAYALVATAQPSIACLLPPPWLSIDWEAKGEDITI